MRVLNVAWTGASGQIAGPSLLSSFSEWVSLKEIPASFSDRRTSRLTVPSAPSLFVSFFERVSVKEIPALRNWGHLPPDKPPNGSPRPPPYSRESVRGIGEKDSTIAVNVL
jgi:hypothetical protein